MARAGEVDFPSAVAGWAGYSKALAALGVRAERAAVLGRSTHSIDCSDCGDDGMLQNGNLGSDHCAAARLAEGEG
jgi:hypothetical protein